MPAHRRRLEEHAAEVRDLARAVELDAAARAVLHVLGACGGRGRHGSRVARRRFGRVTGPKRAVFHLLACPSTSSCTRAPPSSTGSSPRPGSGCATVGSPRSPMARSAARPAARSSSSPRTRCSSPASSTRTCTSTSRAAPSGRASPPRRAAAAAGGVTTIVDMPLNSIPPTTTVGSARRRSGPSAGRRRRHRLLGRRGARRTSARCARCTTPGCFGFKAFLAPSGVRRVRPPRRRAARARARGDRRVRQAAHRARRGPGRARRARERRRQRLRRASSSPGPTRPRSRRSSG